MTVGQLQGNYYYLRDELAEQTSCNYTDCRWMLTYVLLGCNLEIYRILWQHKYSCPFLFLRCPYFLLLGMRVYLHKTVCLATCCKFCLVFRYLYCCAGIALKQAVYDWTSSRYQILLVFHCTTNLQKSFLCIKMNEKLRMKQQQEF